MRLTRAEAIQMFDSDVEDGALYGRSHEAFEQWCEDNDVQIVESDNPTLSL